MIEILEGSVSGRAQLVSTLGSLVLLGIIIYLIRRGQLKSGYSILWFFICSTILIISIFNTLLFQLSSLIGVYYAPSTVFSILIVGIILVTIHFSVVLTKHEEKIKVLTQENALLSEKLKVKSEKSNKTTYKK